jgi:hypothetical protein
MTTTVGAEVIGAPAAAAPARGEGDRIGVAASQAGAPPFRFYDNRQKYLAFVNTCNEKATVAARAAKELRAYP